MKRKEKKAIGKLIFALATLVLINGYSISKPIQQELIEQADMLLDMMEYKGAIDKYLKVLSKNPQLRDIRNDVAYAYFQLEQIDNTFKYLKEEFELFPENEDAHDLLMYVLFRLNRLKEANSLLESLNFPIRLTEENPHIGGLGCFILGVYFKQNGNFDNARKYFRKALEKGHDQVKCYVQLTDTEWLAGNPEFSREVLLEATQKCGYKPEFFFMYGLRYVEKAETDLTYLPRAIRCFERSLELNSLFKEAHFNLACLSYNRSKDFRKALEHFQRVLQIEPENAEVKFYVECCRRRLSKSISKEASSECPQKINLSRGFIDNPDREYYRFKNDVSTIIENINYLGLEFIRMGKNYEAIRRFRTGLKINPESPEINFNLGMVFSWLRYLNEAEKHALMALRQRNFFGRLPLARRYEIIKKNRDYLSRSTGIPVTEWTFENAIEEGNFYLDAYDLLGNVYFKKGELDKSVLAFKKVIEIDPEDPIGHYNLGCAYQALNDPENAEAEWIKAIKYEKELKKVQERGKVSEDQLDISVTVMRRPVSFRAHKSLGRLYLNKNLSDKALTEFEKAIELEPGDPEPYYELGKIYQVLSETNEKDIEKAIFYFEKYLYLGREKEAEVKEILESLKKK